MLPRARVWRGLRPGRYGPSSGNPDSVAAFGGPLLRRKHPTQRNGQSRTGNLGEDRTVAFIAGEGSPFPLLHAAPASKRQPLTVCTWTQLKTLYSVSARYMYILELLDPQFPTTTASMRSGSFEPADDVSRPESDRRFRHLPFDREAPPRPRGQYCGRPASPGIAPSPRLP